MKNLQKDLIVAAVISLIILLPFIMMEILNRKGMPESFPVFLFAFLWLLQGAFLFLILPLVKKLWIGKGFQLKFTALLVRLPVMIFIAWMWSSILVDQMPCFLGVVNCD